MLALERSGRRHRRRAAVVAQVAVTSTLIMGMGALVIDIGMLYTAQTELQVTADAAALAAAAALSGTGDVQAAAIAAADEYAARNKVMGRACSVLPGDVEFGEAVPVEEGTRFVFAPAVNQFNAVRVTIRHFDSDGGGSPPVRIPLTFAHVFGLCSKDLEANAAAVLIPRDIAVVIDLSASMNDDSELRHYCNYTGEQGDPRQGVQVNLRDVWCALDGPAPTRPYVPGAENETEYATDMGPSIGSLPPWGEPVTLQYDPTTDPGLWYVPRSTTCQEAAVTSSLQIRGYTADEVTLLKSGSKDGSYSTQWRNRAAVICGLATWRSGRPGGRPGGDGDSYVENGELTWEAYPEFRENWTWSEYVDYVGNTSKMTETNSNFRRRFGLKTFTNFLLEKKPARNQTATLWQTPEQPLQSVKDAVQAMVEVIDGTDNLDQVSLEVFATSAMHEVDLTAEVQNVAETLYHRQAGHYNSTTAIGAGLETAIAELTSARARAAARKFIVVMSDGKPNVDRDGQSTDEGAPSAVAFCVEEAERAAELGMRVYTVSVGGDADADLMQQMAGIGQGQWFHAEGTPEEYGPQLEAIFRTLGGKRPVTLIE